MKSTIFNGQQRANIAANQQRFALKRALVRMTKCALLIALVWIVFFELLIHTNP